MCGIFGWFTPGRTIDKARAAQALNLMKHRGPDDEGYLFYQFGQNSAVPAAGDETQKDAQLPSWRDPSVLPGADSVLGFRRLSIQDLTIAGHQPMGTCDGKLWIVFNGEVYNFVELRAELERSGIQFFGRTDTEVVLRAYEMWGDDCVKKFNGMWAFAILDLRKDGAPKLVIVRDRLGVKPLFYTEDGVGGLAFASELKALLPLRDAQWKVDSVAASNFLAWGRYPSATHGDTFLSDVRMLPPGCRGEWTGGALKIGKWWSLPEEGDGTKCDEGEAVERLKFLLEDSVRLRLRADVPIGSCLSGGLDSSAIVAIVSQLLHDGRGTTHTGTTQHTFSAVYHQDGPWNEKKFVDRVVATFPVTPHFTYPDGERLKADFHRLVWHQEEPFCSTSIFAQWCVMQSIREQNVTVLLDGQAADELFAGYRPYRWFFRDQVRKGRLGSAVKEAQLIAKNTGDEVAKPFLKGALMALIPDGIMRKATKEAYSAALRRAAGKVLRSSKVGPLIDRVRDARSSESLIWRRAIDGMDEHLRGLVNESSLPDILRFEDRNSMAFSLEARVPFTDYRLVEYAFSPAMRDLKQKDGWAKWGLRQAVKDLLPEDIVWRRDKKGFGTPEPLLVRQLAEAYGSKVPSDGLASEYIDARRLKATMQTALDEPKNRMHALPAFRCMVFNSWANQFPVC